jgi:hypothetical protein
MSDHHLRFSRWRFAFGFAQLVVPGESELAEASMRVGDVPHGSALA